MVSRDKKIYASYAPLQDSPANSNSLKKEKKLHSQSSLIIIAAFSAIPYSDELKCADS